MAGRGLAVGQEARFIYTDSLTLVTQIEEGCGLFPSQCEANKEEVM